MSVCFNLYQFFNITKTLWMKAWISLRYWTYSDKLWYDWSTNNKIILRLSYEHLNVTNCIHLFLPLICHVWVTYLSQVSLCWSRGWWKNWPGIDLIIFIELDANFFFTICNMPCLKLNKTFTRVISKTANYKVRSIKVMKHLVQHISRSQPWYGVQLQILATKNVN